MSDNIETTGSGWLPGDRDVEVQVEAFGVLTAYRAGTYYDPPEGGELEDVSFAVQCLPDTGPELGWLQLDDDEARQFLGDDTYHELTESLRTDGVERNAPDPDALYDAWRDRQMEASW